MFAGIGGFSLAASWMGWETVAYVEWDKWCQKILAKNFPNTLRFGDIVEFNKMLQNGEIIAVTKSGRHLYGEDEKQSTETRIDAQRQSYGGNTHERINLGHIDIITGGFPCQPFSHAGKRKGTNDSRYLWPEMLTTIRILKPSFVVGENVAGLISMENGKTLDGILSDLANEGYQTEQFIIPACGVGAWHRRDRIWIIAHSINSTNRTIGGQGSETEGISELNRSSGLSGEFSRTGSEIPANSRHFRPEISKEQATGIIECGKDVPDSKEQRIQRVRRIREQGAEENVEQRLSLCSSDRNRANSDWWTTEPSVGRVANGIPNRVDRLKGLGNAIVPQVVFEIFKAIEEFAYSENKE